MKRALTVALLGTFAALVSFAQAQTILFDDFEYSYQSTGFPDLGIASGGLWNTGYNGGSGNFYSRWSFERYSIRPDGGGATRWAGAGSTGGDIWSTRALPAEYSNGIMNVYAWIDSRSSDANTDNIAGFGLSGEATVNSLDTQAVGMRYRSYANNTLEIDLPHLGGVTWGPADGTPAPSPEFTNTNPDEFNQWQHVRLELNIDTQKATLFKDLNRSDPNVDDWSQLGSQVSTGPVGTIRYVSLFTARDSAIDDLLVTYTPGVVNKWNVNADGNWSDPANWSAGIPSGPSATANFTDAILQDRTVTLDHSETVGVINFNNVHRYTIAGSGTLSLDTLGSDAAAINVIAGSHTISTPMTLPKPLNVNVGPADSTLTLSGEIAAIAAITVTKTGAGELEMSDIRADGLDINAGNVKVLANGTATGTSKVKELTIAGSIDAWDAQLDLSNNSLIVDYTSGSPVATIRNQVKNGYNLGLWSGSGITSSSAAADHSKGLGTGEASAVLGSSGGTFAGQTVDGTAVLVKYTWRGDANLDGQVDISDLGALATAWQTSAPWTGGDFDYSGFVDISDLGILATNWQAGVGSPLGPSFDEALASVGLAGVSVPEPQTLGILLSIGGGLVSARRRRSN